jgi:ribose 5-phosphate isomerase A
MTAQRQNADIWKRAAASRALDYVEDGMKLGLGTGSTAEAFLDLLAERIKNGLKVVGTPTSERTAIKARALGIPLGDLDLLGSLDLAVDGTDEADRNLDLIKGGGGAMLREKIVAASAGRFVVIADEGKLKHRLGAFPLPVEVARFGHPTTAARIVSAAGSLNYRALTPRLRTTDGNPFATDNGNFIYDCPFGAIEDADALAAMLSAIPGVVDHGLFVGMTSVLILAGASGIQVLERR